MSNEKDQQKPEHPNEKYQVQIDRVHYTIQQSKLTGAQLRQLPTPPIGPDRDLYQVVPGQQDLKIEEQDSVEIKNGMRFFTAPAHINPGQRS